MAPNRWDRLLVLNLVGVAAFASAMVLAGDVVGRLVFDPVGAGPAGAQLAAGSPHEYVLFIYAVLGAVLLGWTVTMLVLAVGPLRARERWAWWAVSSGAAVWFVVDVAASLVLGFSGNALVNLVFGLALGIPLAMIGREVRHQRTPG